MECSVDCKIPLKQCEVLINFPLPLNEEQQKHIFKAVEELSKAGIEFDTGGGCGGLDWEFDWSLKGANVYFKRFMDDNERLAEL